MKGWKGSVGIITLVLAVTAITLPVSAHELTNDNGISAELHIPPLDQPVTNQLTRLQFSFENPPATFSLPECDCRLQAAGPGDVVLTASAQLDGSQKNMLLSQFTFPKAGDYTITLSGFTGSNQKNLFHLAYPVHVDPASVTVSQRSKLLGTILIALCGIAAIAVLVQYYRPRRKPHHLA